MHRMTFNCLPEDVRQAVTVHTGPITAVVDSEDGANSAIAAFLTTDLDGQVFVKGVPLDHPQHVSQEREAAINPYLPDSSPRLLWHVQTGGWDLLGFEYVPGRLADYSPGSADLPLLVDVLTEVAGTKFPAGLPIKRARDRWTSYVHDWAVPMLAGRHLLHTDLAPHNVLIGDRAHLIDWAWPTVGAPWIDPAVWVIRLIDAGHTPASAEVWARRVPAFRQAIPQALDAFARANRLIWGDIATESGGAWQKSMATSAASWHDYRQHPHAGSLDEEA